MSRPRISESPSEPVAEDCSRGDDVGKLHHNLRDDIWYECLFDDRRAVYTWAILPSTGTRGDC